MSKVTEEQANKLEADIEDIELHDMDGDEIERVVSGLSGEGMTLRRERKKVRYQLYRLKSEAEGVSSSVSEESFKEKFEKIDLFDGWKNFSLTWDVAMDDPYRIVHRTHSVLEEWDEVIKSKFPSIEPGGKINYPDIKVRKRVEAESKLQEATKAKKKKSKKKKGSK